MGLSEKAQAHPAQLSGGQKQRVGIARTLNDVAAAVNLNYAIPAGIDPNSALAKEDRDTRYGLWFTARAKGRNGPRVAKLVALYRSPEVKLFILERFGGTIIPTW